ncbi:class I SAM-dependent methyltransferase [Asanoa sp. WMMD1127]|uniref:class I SAM-dependent methyltransferase n=1 Tax=Asanoa sp. WMMD1127 TaxID=3016107 RepID=UPI0024180375|nr:class I SAM-dependent methyltransferase [Asanoa sp. WMMD1127]MDG4825882.1 class I SAM-dependent methyltransferase [Asanoa sp. WMMD1127]
MGSAKEQGRLWGAAVDDWAAVCEPWSRPLYAATLAAVSSLAGMDLLDAGCGSGLALKLAADRGARVAGLDAAAAMVERAADRVPGADLRVGDIADLPFEDGVFDVVTAFNSVQYAADPAAAVADLVRVTRPGGRVALGVWGDPERCETEILFRRIRDLAPSSAAPLAISAPGVVEGLLAGAGLAVATVGEVECPFTFPDRETGWRGQSAIGPLRAAIDAAGESAVRAAYADAVDRFRQPDGSYRQRNVFRYVVGRKPAQVESSAAT